MRHILLLCACLVASPLAAATISHVDFNLPKYASEWKSSGQMVEGKKGNGTTIVYIPENTSQEEAHEYFAVHANNLPTDLSNRDALHNDIEKSLSQLLSKTDVNPKISLEIVDSTPESVLYEWSITAADKEKFHGWIRGFVTHGDTVVLMYQTDRLNNDTGTLWVQTLKDAKIAQ